MFRTLANTSIKSPYLWLVFFILGGVVLAEVLYYYVLDLEGCLSGIFSIQEEVSQQGWWNDERKGVWILGALAGVALVARILLWVF